MDILWKTFSLSSACRHGARSDRKNPQKYGVVSAIHRQAAWQHDCTRRSFLQKPVPKMKDPSGGTTGRVKPYGRLGWMGARAEYSGWGGITAPTQHKSQQGPRTFKTARGFF